MGLGAVLFLLSLLAVSTSNWISTVTVTTRQVAFLPNQLIFNVSTSQPAADALVRANLLPFYPPPRSATSLSATRSSPSRHEKRNWHDLVTAMHRLRRSLKSLNLHKVKVRMQLAMDALATSFPPSSGLFQAHIAEPVIKPLLQFLNRTKSFYFLDVHTYFTWADNHKTTDLDFAILNRTGGLSTPTRFQLGLRQSPGPDSQRRPRRHGRRRLPGVRIWIAETGWPNAGDVDQIGASVLNAAVYNRNLARRSSAARWRAGAGRGTARATRSGRGESATSPTRWCRMPSIRIGTSLGRWAAPATSMALPLKPLLIPVSLAVSLHHPSCTVF